MDYGSKDIYPILLIVVILNVVRASVFVLIGSVVLLLLKFTFSEVSYSPR